MSIAKPFAQLKADVPVELKRRAMSELSLRGKKFGPAFRERLEEWVSEMEQETLRRNAAKREDVSS